MMYLKIPARQDLNKDYLSMVTVLNLSLYLEKVLYKRNITFLFSTKVLTQKYRLKEKFLLSTQNFGKIIFAILR